MVILKHAIARICALKTNSELIQSNPTFAEKLTLSLDSIHKLENSKAELLEKLHSYNSNNLNSKTVNAVQNVRRSIHNGRNLKNKDITVLRNNDETLALNWIEDYERIENNHKKNIENFYSMFLEEWGVKRTELLEMSKSDSIYNGLLLSSNSLIDALNNRQTQNKIPNKKERQIEIGLLKYVTRSLFKPTPFSSFTQLNHVKIESSSSNSFSKTESDTNVSFVRINNAIFQRIRFYMTKIQEVFLYLEVNLNPSLDFNAESNQFKILINKNNLEFFQTIDQNGIVQLITNFLNENKTVQFSDLIHHCKQYIDAEEDDIIKYALKLANIGLFEFNYKASGTDIDWIEKLNRGLHEMPESEGRDMLINLLNDLELSRVQYEANFSNLEERKKILEIVSENLNRRLANLSRKVNPEIEDEKHNNVRFKKEKIFLEDTLSKREMSIGDEYLKPFLSKIDRLIDYCSEYSILLNKQKDLFKFYVKEYQSDEVPLLKFYEDYFRYLKAEKEKSKNNDAKSNETKSVTPVNYLSESLFDITEKSKGEINFSFNKEHIDKKVKHSYSSSMFFQMARVNDKPGIVVNGLGWGYGRMSSRFLYMFDQEFTDDIKSLNKSLTDDIIYSEINDASFFNANLHPPLFTHECNIPGGHKNVKEEFQLKVNELLIRKDDEDKKLILIDSRTNQQVFIHDSCFQGEKGRSQLFNLLALFSDKVTPMYKLLLGDINKKKISKVNSYTTVYPRIVFEDTILLQRKYWIINSPGFPVIEAEEKEYEYYLRILSWFKKLEIPNKVFVTLNYNRNSDKSFAPDDYKPQFIDIENPLFLPLIIKLFKKTESIKIMEMAPSVADSVTFNDAQQTVEFLIQWYNGANYKR